jgi:hypothetical protein
VVGVAPVQRRVQGAGVEDQRQERVPARSSPDLRAVSGDPEAPIPRLLGFGRYAPTFSSIASRISDAIEVLCSAAILRSRSNSSSGSEMVVRSMTS